MAGTSRVALLHGSTFKGATYYDEAAGAVFAYRAFCLQSGNDPEAFLA